MVVLGRDLVADHTTVVKAKGLKHHKYFGGYGLQHLSMDYTDTKATAFPDAFAEVYVGDKVLRTKIVKGSLDPHWNETFDL